MVGQACSTRSPAVTRLTVYRRLQVPAQGIGTCAEAGTYVGKMDACAPISLAPSTRFGRHPKTGRENHCVLPHAKFHDTHPVKSSVRFKFFQFQDFAEFPWFCLSFARITQIPLVFAGFCANMRISRIYGLLCEVPGGNQVDASPPVASVGTCAQAGT